MSTYVLKLCFTVFTILLISCESGDSEQKGIQSLEEAKKHLGKIERKIVLNGRLYGDVVLKDNYLYYLSINDSIKRRPTFFYRLNLTKEEPVVKIELPHELRFCTFDVLNENQAFFIVASRGELHSLDIKTQKFALDTIFSFGDGIIAADSSLIVSAITGFYFYKPSSKSVTFHRHKTFLGLNSHLILKIKDSKLYAAGTLDSSNGAQLQCYDLAQQKLLWSTSGIEEDCKKLVINDSSIYVLSSNYNTGFDFISKFSKEGKFQSTYKTKYISDFEVTQDEKVVCLIFDIKKDTYNTYCLSEDLQQQKWKIDNKDITKIFAFKNIFFLVQENRTHTEIDVKTGVLKDSFQLRYVIQPINDSTLVYNNQVYIISSSAF